MATLVLGAVGGLLGGPLGVIVGSAIGQGVDRAAFGGGRRQGPRLSDLAVQGSSYGEAVPRLYGMTRVAGQVIWSTGLIETAHSSGGGKRSGPRTTSYSYAASFAVLLSAREIIGVRRVWADGKLLRGSDGGMLFPGVMRVHLGSEGQAPDILIESAEGMGAAPAYRGLAYAVFEDLQLAEFANRVPNLTFEIEADSGPVSAGVVVSDLFEAAEAGTVETSGAGGSLVGFSVGRQTSLRSVLGTLGQLVPLSAHDDGAQLVVTSAAPVAVAIPDVDLGGASDGGVRVRAMTRRAAADALPTEVAVGFADPERDYQPGLQRARRRGGASNMAFDLPATMVAGAAKACAERLLGEAWTARLTGEVMLPWRWATLAPGDAVRVAADDWRVRGWTMEGLSVALEVERMPGVIAATSAVSDGGRANVDVDLPHGPTVIEVMDLPPIGADLPTTARLWLAAAGPSAGWRRAEVLVSRDAGATYESLGIIGGPSIMGTTVTVLGEGPCERWDRRNSVEVELLSDAMWLESRSIASVLAGANLALIGDELVQFTTVEALGTRRFRLSGLLRGRRGSEAAAVGHGVGERFVLLDPLLLLPFDAPVGSIGGTLMFKAVGPGDLSGSVPVVTVPVIGRALRPLSPVHVRGSRVAGGDIELRWTRRSRQGFDWIDGADAPLGEETERYALTIRSGGPVLRASSAFESRFTYTAADQAADFGGPVVDIDLNIAQTSALTGPGAGRMQDIHIPA